MTRDIAGSMHQAASNTVRASQEIRSVEAFANQSAAAVEDIGAWTEKLSSGAKDLEAHVTRFFSRVRAA